SSRSGNKCQPRSKTVAAASIHDHSFVDQHPVVLPADLDRAGSDTRLARRRKHHALARGEDGLETHRRPRLTPREGGNDPEAVALDGVVGHPGDLAEVNAPTLDRPEFISVRCADGGQSECDGEDGAMDAHCFLLMRRRAGAPLVATMPAKIAHFFAAAL